MSQSSTAGPKAAFRLPELAADLVRRQVAVIAATGGNISALTAKAATTAIPIVFTTGSDPVKLGLVASLSRPGGNLTGASFFLVDLDSKVFGLLHQLMPEGPPIAVLVNPKSPEAQFQLVDIEQAARELARKVEFLNASTAAEIDQAFVALTEHRAGALVISADPFFVGQKKNEASEHDLCKGTSRLSRHGGPSRDTAAGAGCVLEADARQRRRGLRRHRHQSALCRSRGFVGGSARRGTDTGSGARHPLADLLGSDHRRHTEIHSDSAAGRQQWSALAFRALGHGAPIALFLGIVGASMFYGSVFITPALSVLSAVEGLNVATPAFEPYVLPLAVFILVALFSVQSRGTAKVSALFGPITLLWFIVIAAAGAVQIAGNPGVLVAIDPLYGIAFLAEHRVIGLVALGAVFLVVTGSEALYNDLGHFGRKPIQTAWVVLVLPALVINYFGQGALVLESPKTVENPFFRLFPEWGLYPMVALATAATVIASQAVITGAYSITRQAIQLGLIPRLEIRHTSEALAGQIYLPRVNWVLLVGVLLLVLMFRSSSELASAYVLAVSTTNLMAVTLGFIVIWKLWQWPLSLAAPLMMPFIAVDATFVMATSLKLLEGAWLPVAFGILMILLILTWRCGTNILAGKTRRTEVPLNTLLRSLENKPPHIVPGAAVFLTSDPQFAPTALLHNLKHNKVLHEHNIILTIVTVDTPRVPAEERVTISRVSKLFSAVTLMFGYMEQPNVPRALAVARKHGWTFDIMSTSFFLSRRSLKPSPQSGMPLWQDRLFIFLARTANDATDYFRIPTERVVEVGTQITV